METPVIRAATAEDIPSMDRLLRELASFVGEPEAYGGNLESLRRHGFGPQKVFHSLLAMNQDSAVGLVNYFPDYSTWRGQPGVYILDLCITEAQRGGGLGRRMLAETLRRASSAWEAGYIRLSVHGHNEAAIRFYTSLGFRESEGEWLMVAPKEAFRS
jgi:ribosomal protein S18 acetylase RimI-like enzyme